jgi:outer membrane lipoprotein LolB
VGALAAWAAGARADVQAFGPARLEFTADGTLARIEQDGWIVDYLGWREAHPGAGGPEGGQRLQLPDRINAARGDARVRLAIDTWSWAPEAP